MDKKDFDRVLEQYLVEGWISSEDYEKMDEMQTYVIQAIKRARSRIKNRTKEEKTYVK